MKNLFVLSVILFSTIFSMTINAEDSSWGVVKQKSGETWDATKKASGETWDKTKKVSSEAWDSATQDTEHQPAPVQEVPRGTSSKPL